MISLDYDDTLQAAAGEQVEDIRKKIMKDYPDGYILAVEGNVPTKDGGVYGTFGCHTFLDVLQETSKNAKAIVAWGSCASIGTAEMHGAMSLALAWLTSHSGWPAPEESFGRCAMHSVTRAAATGAS